MLNSFFNKIKRWRGRDSSNCKQWKWNWWTKFFT